MCLLLFAGVYCCAEKGLDAFEKISAPHRGRVERRGLIDTAVGAGEDRLPCRARRCARWVTAKASCVVIMDRLW
jgi:hypothetical protein